MIEVFVDGGSRGQGKAKVGDAACAAVIFKNRKKIAEYARPLGRRTNNEAEYEALICGLLICAMSTEITDPIIYSDSSVVVNQVNGKWECKDEKLVPLLMSVNIIKKEYRFKLVQVPRSFVHDPDYLLNQCLDQLQAERQAAIAKKANA